LADQAIVGELASRRDDSRWYALSRTCFNAGMGAGAVVGGLLVALADGYALLALCNALSFWLAAGLFLAVPSARRAAADRTARRQERPRATTAWRDSLFVLVTAANALLWLAAMAVEIALPVYLKEYAGAPGWTISLAFVLNTVLVTGCQLALAKRTEAAPRMRVMAWGGVCYAAAFGVLLLSVGTPLGLLVALLVVSVTVFTVGEILVTVSGTVTTTRLAPPERRGAYLAVNHLMLGAAGVVAPLALTSLLDVDRRLMWAVVGLGSLALSALLVRLRQAVAVRTGEGAGRNDPTADAGRRSPAGESTQA
jgi:MFS family permease